jgi:WD40 repeat protein
VETATVPLGESCAGIAFSPDGRDFATFGDGSATVALWERSTGTKAARFQTEDYLGATAYSSSGSSSPPVTRLTMWMPGVGQRIFSIDAMKPVARFAFSPDGNLLASGGGDGTVRVWDVITRKQVVEFAAHADDDDDGVSVVAFSPDGSLIATSDSTGEVKMWKGFPDPSPIHL